MNALVKKEIRLMLPSLAVALLLALPPICTRSDDGIPVFLLFIGMTMMSLTTFGRECSLNTFSSMLAQPAERMRIWKTKLAVLVLSFGAVYTVWRLAIAFSFKDYGGRLADPEYTATVLTVGNIVVIATFTGGLWTTLLVRQIASAFWLTLLFPGALAGFTGALLAEHHSEDTVRIAISIVIGIYSIAGFAYAWRLFFQSQDVGWAGGVIALPEWTLIARSKEGGKTVRARRPIFALVKKELQLQQVSFMGAAGLLVLHLGIVGFRSHHVFVEDSALQAIVIVFWVLWLVLPVFISAITVAEERRLGMMEGQLCLPVSRGRQFAIKAFTTLFLGTLLGGIVPMLIENIGANTSAFAGSHSINQGMGVSVQFYIIAFAASLSLVSFYASTMARNFLQAVGFSMVTFVALVLVTTAFVDHDMIFTDLLPHKSVLPAVVGIPTGIVTLLWLGYLNFRNFRPGWPLWRRNMLGVTGGFVFVLVASIAIYNRVWEVLEAAEPQHGPARLSLANPPIINSEDSVNLSIRLSDGRVWFDCLGGGMYQYSDMKTMIWRACFDPLPRSIGIQRFAEGSNWVSMTGRHIDWQIEDDSDATKTPYHIIDDLDTVGVRPDGSLWISEASKDGQWKGDRMRRFGDENVWKQVVGSHAAVLLLKNDRTIWRWGTNRFDFNKWGTRWFSVRNYPMHQVGNDAVWSELYFGRWIDLARKSDGSVWRITSNDKNGADVLTLQTNMEQVSFKTLALADSRAMAYVRPDGSLWVKWQPNTKPEVVTEFVRVGSESNWRAVAMTWLRMVALKSDGTLWEWRLTKDKITEFTEGAPTRLGIHNDWVAISDAEDNAVALAADGSLWLWPDRQMYGDRSLLKLSKQPKLLGNIFSVK